MSLGAVLESARELTREAASSTARLMDSTPQDSGDIRRLIRSPSERDHLSGLRAVLALMAQGNDARDYFPDIVKLVTSADFSVRQLVYAYIVQYAEYEPDLALMAINGVQKFLGDQNAVVRSTALKTISSIRLPAIASIISLAIKELLYDPSPIVRTTCARAAGKCYELDGSLVEDLLEYLKKLAQDADASVQGAAMAVIAVQFPSRLDLVHKVYKRTCRNLEKYAEWDQIVVVRLLIYYCRRFMASNRDPDLALLFRGLEPLLASANAGVVVEAAAALHYLGPQDTFTKLDAAPALTRLEPTELVLQNVYALIVHHPADFLPYLSWYFLTLQETRGAQVLKLKILGVLADSKSLPRVLAELKFYAESVEDPILLRTVMETLAKCAVQSHESTAQVTKWLVKVVVANEFPHVVSEALVALRVLMQQTSEQDRTAARGTTLTHLVHILSQDSLPTGARRTIVWLIGEYVDEQPRLASEVLRIAAKTMAEQDTEVRLQMIELAAKIYSRFMQDSSKFDPRVPELYKHIIYLGQYDPDYDTRDRARMIHGLFQGEEPELATLLLQTTKPAPQFSSDVDLEGTQFLVGSASLAVGHPLTGYVSLQDWGGTEPTQSLREESPEPVRYSTSSQSSRNQSQSSNRDQGSRSQPPQSFSSDQLPPRKVSEKKALTLEQFLQETESETETESESESQSESDAESGSEVESEGESESVSDPEDAEESSADNQRLLDGAGPY